MSQCAVLTSCGAPGCCRCLARGLALTETLVVLELSNNGLDDDKLRMLASGLADNISVTHLNLSHNRISDRCVHHSVAARCRRQRLVGLQLVDGVRSSCLGCQACGRCPYQLLSHCRFNGGCGQFM